MPDHCTCGTQLVEGARFCHKCGRPVSGEPDIPPPIQKIESIPAIQPEVSATQAPAARPVEQPRISFGNPTALRIAFAAASFAIILDITPVLSVLCIVWSMAAGFVAVHLYRKRTGQRVSVGSGAKLGWITGVFTFALLTLIMTVFAVSSGGKWTDEYRKQMTAMAAHDANYQQVLRAFDSPAAFAAMILSAIFLFLILLSLASVAGGALGARFSNKE